MTSSLSFYHRFFIGALLFPTFIYQVSALNIAYCSDLNTAQTPANSSIYQSNGLCYNFCLEDYAFAILQDSTCWCSNDAPGDTTSTSDCNVQCPGYPNDLCGNSGEGLYGYLALNKNPTATVGGSTAAASPTHKETVTASPATIIIVDTETVTPFSSSTSSEPTTTSSIPAVDPVVTSSTTTKESSSSSTWTPTPVTSLETVTGQIRTVTVTPTIPPNSQSLTGVAANKGSSSGLSTGGAVGLTVGLVALVALVCSIIYFCIRKRQKERARAAGEFDNNASRRGSSAGLGGPIPSRTMSENSRYVLGTDGRQVVETWEPETREAPGSRTSRLVPIDPRLDPFAPVYQRGDNKSRESVNTIRDDHDYSRRVHQQGPILRATNPDQ